MKLTVIRLLSIRNSLDNNLLNVNNKKTYKAMRTFPWCIYSDLAERNTYYPGRAALELTLLASLYVSSIKFIQLTFLSNF